MEIVLPDHLWGALIGVAILALRMSAPGGSQAVDRSLVESFLTVSEVARHLRVSNMTVYRLVNSGQLPAVRVGRGYRIREGDVRKYLEQRYMDAG
jgi:excisionase family DNA binding protein